MREVESRTPLQADTSLNCLLYCEMVDNHERPKNLTLNHHGNFVTRGTTLTDSDDQIDGAFVLGYKHFLESYLLPRIKALNQASDIYVQPVSWIKDNRGYGDHTVNWEYSVGLDPNHSKSNDAVYDYKRYPAAHVEDNSVAYYEFKKHNIQQCADYAFDPSSHHKYVHQCESLAYSEWVFFKSANLLSQRMPASRSPGRAAARHSTLLERQHTSMTASGATPMTSTMRGRSMAN